MEARSAPGSPARRSGGEVQSVARAAMLVARIAESETPLTLSELARATRLSVSTAYRLLHTLSGHGLVCRDPGGERYLPGPTLMRLARASLLNAGVADINDALGRLAESSRETVSVGVRDGAEVVIVLTSPSPEALRIERRVGERLPLGGSALGRAIAAFDEQAAAAIPSEGAGKGVVGTDTTSLAVELMAIQFRGWAVGDEDELVGVRSLAAPIQARGGSPAAVELQGPTARMTDEALDALGESLRRTAVALAQLPLAAILG